MNSQAVYEKVQEGTALGGPHHRPGMYRQQWGAAEDLGQGLTFPHFSAQPEPFLTQKHFLNTPYYP